MKPKAIVSLALAAISSASRLSARVTTCQEACYTQKPECKNGMFPLQSADGVCWSCCISDAKVCLQVCFDEPPTCDDGMLPTKNGECYTCCRTPPLPTETEVEPFPLPIVVPRSFEMCDRQCDDEPPACGDWVAFQPSGGPCWACCDPTSLPSTGPEIANEPEVKPKSLRPEICNPSCSNKL